MKISFHIEPEHGIIALMEIIALHGIITSKKQFKAKLQNYFRNYGHLCLDDHDNEYGVNFDAALETWNKYGEAIASKPLPEYLGQ